MPRRKPAARRVRSRLNLRTENLEPRTLLAADPIISEFVADNHASLLDGDGNASDWIEIHNRGDEAIDLAGWHLTDDAANLAKWTFPSRLLDPDGYLIVFASNPGVENYIDGGGNPHANFALDAGGEYLGLVRPDGTTIASEFSPAYPPQGEDISYGVENAAVQSVPLVPATTAGKFHVPAGAVAGWQNTSFDDSAWTNVTSGVGFEVTGGGLPTGLTTHFAFDDPAASPTAHETVRNVNETVAGTHSFVAGQFGSALSFGGSGVNTNVPLTQNPAGMRDGFTIATWIRSEAANGTIAGWHDNTLTKGFWLGYISGGPWLSIAAGANAAAGSTGAAIQATAPNTISLNTWYHLAVVFDPSDTAEEVKFYIDGTKLTAGVTNANLPDGQMGDAASQMFRVGIHNAGSFPFKGQMDDFAVFDRPLGALEVAAIKTAGVTGTATYYDDLIETDVAASMHDVNASSYLRIPFSVDDPSAFNALQLGVNYDDGFVAHLNGVEVARRNAPATVTSNSAATAQRDPAEALAHEVIDMSAHVGLLVAGSGNVLAIQGLNASASDDDFLLSADLTAQTISEQIRFFPTPSPLAPNIGGAIGFVDDTTFSVDRGFFDAPFSVDIATNTPGATIRYTTDGSEPTATHGNVYSGPIAIATTTTLRAAAFKDDHLPTNIDTQTYLFAADVIRQPSAPAGYPTTWSTYQIGPVGTPVPADYAMNQTIVDNPAYSGEIVDAMKSLPTLSLVMSRDDWFDQNTGIYVNPFGMGNDWERTVSAEWIDPSGGDEFQIDAGVRVFGGYSRHFWATPKKSFTLRFQRDHGPPKLNFDVFENNDVDQFDLLVLRAVFSDAWPDGASPPQYLRDHFARQTQLAMGQPSSDGNWVHLYINGLYWGIYNPSERPDANFAASHFGGEPEEYDAIKHGGLLGPGQVQNNTFEVVDGDSVAWQQALSLASGGLSSSAAYAQFKQLVDVENLADYILLNHFIGNTDWPHKNWWANRRRAPGEGFKFYAWDSEYTLNSTTVDRTGVNNQNTPAFLYNAARQNEEFRLLFADRVQKHMFNDGALTAENNIERYTRLATQIESAIIAESARWGDNAATRQGATNYTRDGHWRPVRDSILSGFFPQRPGIALTQLRNASLYPNIDAPSYNQFGGDVTSDFDITLTAPAGSIYYTTDGSDPRQGSSSVATTTLFSQGAAARALVPMGPIDNAWRTVGFDDAAWIAGTTGVGYERNAGYEAQLGINLLGAGLDPGLRIDTNGDGTNENNSVFVRVPFTVSSLADVNFMQLRMKADDGFVAYLNGVKVAEQNAPAAPTWNSAALGDNPDAVASVFASFDISAFVGQLVVGQNVLAIHGLNANATSSDMLIVPELDIGVAAATGISPTAVLYTGAFNLDDSATVTARSLSGATWSAATVATFTVGDPPPLRITEIMYNPAGNDDAEFIELQNVGLVPVNLQGVKFTSGIAFTFGEGLLAPGERAVVARSIAGFTAKYGAEGINVVGEYTGTALDNGGERIALADAFGRVIQDFQYNDGWYPITDDLGFSLTIIDASAATSSWSSKSSWRPSSAADGTPGAADPLTTPAPGAIIVNEVVVDTASPGGGWIELLNTTSQPIDVANWYVSDSPASPAKVQIAGSLVIPAGGFAVLSEGTHFGPSAHANGFLLSRIGGELSIVAGTPSGALAGYQETRDYRATESEVAQGRHINSVGDASFVTLVTATPGAANSAPRVGPVVINEIMYNPAAGGDEFIELRNISGGSVSLFDSTEPANTWRIEGAVGFAFPSGVSLPADGYVLVVATNPEAFRAKHGLPAGAAIYGPFSGSLDNGGESIRLVRPGAPIDFSVPEYLVDRVTYDDAAPWPLEADGNGPSLERINGTAFGDDPIRWMRSAFGGSPDRLNVGIDTTPPSVPTNLTGILGGGSSFALSWSAATDGESGVIAYRVFRNDALLATIASTSFVDAAMPAGGALAYRVAAVNGDQVVGQQSSVIQVASLRNGASPSDGYAGTDDVQLAQATPATNLGAAVSLLADTDDPEGTDNDAVVLMRWDTSSLPTTATLQSAAISLRISGATSQVYELYEMRRNWIEGEATWNQFAAGQPWQTTGAAGVQDRGSASLGTVGPISGGSHAVALNAVGLALVQSWIVGSQANHGFVLVPTGDGGGTTGGSVLDDLIAFYDFEDTTGGIARDQSGNNLNGTILAATLESAGFNGSAYRFNGNGHVVAPININPTVRPKLTMGAWVRPDAIGSGLYKILGHDNGGWDRTVGLDERQLGGFRWTAFHGNGTIPNTPAPAFNQWTFVAATYDHAAATMTLYIDLDAATTGDAPQAFASGTSFGAGQTSVAIGNIRPDNLSEAFSGLIDNVFFINDALSAAEIAAIRNGGSGFFLDDALVMASSESPIVADRPQLSFVFTTPSTPILPGDFNNDGLVGVADLGILHAHLGTLGGATHAQGDINGDALVNRADAAAFALQFGKSSLLGVSPAAPSPAAGAVIAAARYDSAIVGAAVEGTNDDAQESIRARRMRAHRRAAFPASSDAVLRDTVWSDALTAGRLARTRSAKAGHISRRT